MLKELFEKDFFVTFPHVSGIMPNVRESVVSTDFALSDQHACGNSCPNYQSCNHEILRIVNPLHKQVNIVDLNDIFGILADPFHDNADYIFCTEKEFVVAELTCISNNYLDSNNGNTYPQGKRAKARAQLETAFLALNACHPIKQFLKRYTSKAILAYRINDIKDINLPSSLNMASFVKMQQAVDSVMPRFYFGNEVEMFIIPYPHEYMI